VFALCYGIGALLDMVWPRSPDQPWYSNYGMIVSVVSICVIGFAIMLARGAHRQGNAPSGDAWLITRRASLTSDAMAQHLRG
jgi:hypothetical protein